MFLFWAKFNKMKSLSSRPNWLLLIIYFCLSFPLEKDKQAHPCYILLDNSQFSIYSSWPPCTDPHYLIALRMDWFLWEIFYCNVLNEHAAIWPISFKTLQWWLKCLPPRPRASPITPSSCLPLSDVPGLMPSSPKWKLAKPDHDLSILACTGLCHSCLKYWIQSPIKLLLSSEAILVFCLPTHVLSPVALTWHPLYPDYMVPSLQYILPSLSRFYSVYKLGL